MSQAISLLSSSNRLNKKLDWSNKTFETLDITTNYNFTSTLDGNTVIKYLDSLYIPAGITVTTQNRCKGLVLFIKGDCIIDGTLSMTARGCLSPGDDLAIDYFSADLLVNPINLASYRYIIDKLGGLGGAAVRSYNTGSGVGLVGNAGQNKIDSCGGGGSGGARSTYGGIAYSGPGAAGTSYSGGAGGGGCCTGGTGTYYGYGGASNGGAGGAGRIGNPGGVTRGAGGGAGNPGGARAVANSGTGSAGSTGTGGLLILVIQGNLIIGSSGLISSNGSNGGDGLYGAGGGSGGGCLEILYTGDYDNKGSVQANGGLGGYSPSPSSSGGAGGAGAIKIEKI